tara:strand:- start:8428 stop:8721 length:294 start_codon:yes stop_codon:yes gene_type:complete
MTPEETATELIITFGDLASNVCDEVLMNVTSLPNIANHYIEVKKVLETPKEESLTLKQLIMEKKEAIEQDELDVKVAEMEAELDSIKCEFTQDGKQV